ncbi:MAG: hypothetical protein WC750_06260 [Patescibacteria group bacterium]|jgi:hypothetical protein
MQQENNTIHTVPLLWADSQDGPLVADVLSFKNYRQGDIYVMVGATVGQAGAITLHKGTSVGGSPATAFAFTRYLETGFVLKYDGPSTDTPAAAGETISGAGGGAATIYKDTGTELICYGYNGTTFVDNETVTCSGGKTVVADGIQVNEDILVPRTAASNTFNINAVGSKIYMIPVSAEDLGDGYDCLELNVADLNTTDLAAWAVMSGYRGMKEIPETAIYD